MKYARFFHTHPVFTREELAEYLKEHRQLNNRTLESLLTYYRKSRRVILVRRGVYAVVPSWADPDRYPVDPFLVASRLVKDSVLSYYSALDLWGLTHTAIRLDFTYSASQPISPVQFRRYTFRGIKFPESLCRAGKEYFGVTTIDRAGMDLKVTSHERTLVDILDRPSLSISWEEMWRSLESIDFFDLDIVVDYVRLLENDTTAARVGFYLEQHRESLMVEERYLQSLRELRPRQPHYFYRSGRESGSLVADWNLVVPEEILKRSWEVVV